MQPAQSEIDEYEFNDLYTSKSVDKLLGFYDLFDSSAALVEWMHNRPSEKMHLYEQNGDTNIVFVIPTANFNGKFANYCKNFYKGHKIIFVESNGPFFNFARSCNFGVERALDYKPNWIIVSNDDLEKGDELSVLQSALDEKVDEKVKLVYIKSEGDEPPMNCSMVRTTNPLLDVYYNTFGSAGKRIWELNKKFGIRYAAYVTDPFNSNSNTVYSRTRAVVARLLLGTARRFPLEGAFIILHGDYARSLKGKIFDETYINSYEDVDLSYNVFKDPANYSFVKFRLKVEANSSLGLDKLLSSRVLVNKIHFNYKYAKEMDKCAR